MQLNEQQQAQANLEDQEIMLENGNGELQEDPMLENEAGIGDQPEDPQLEIENGDNLQAVKRFSKIKV